MFYRKAQINISNCVDCKFMCERIVNICLKESTKVKPLNSDTCSYSSGKKNSIHSHSCSCGKGIAPFVITLIVAAKEWPYP